MAISRFNAFARMSRELQEARDELAGRRGIETAKAILMKAKNISEEEAYRLLRKTAMNQNRKIADIAQSLITAENLMNEQ
ncbi:MAG: hypothetical protein COB93_11065 [Sneathiella sp.]|nr:MAG: hypothetical protein COB93_11065 [Sneathiella sp.]